MTSSDYRIAHVQLLPLLSGVQRVTLDELERLSSDYQRWLICKNEGALTEEALKTGAQILTCQSLVREIHPRFDLKVLWQLWRYCRRHRFDVVHTHSSKTGVLGRLAARLAGVPCIVHTVHGFAFPAAKSRLQRLVFYIMEWIGARCSHLVICLHEEDARICIEALNLPSERVAILPNGIDLKKFSPLADGDVHILRDELRLPVDRQLIIMVGRLWEQKDPGCLVEAYCQLWQQGDPGADLILVGDGDLRQQLQQRVEAAGLQAHVHFLGWRTDTPDLLRASDIFVLPSRWEGMPLAILEAMGTGLPVVVSDIPGNRHLVEHKQQGLLFSMGDSAALADALSKLIANPGLRTFFGTNARQKVAKKHDIRCRVQRIEALYTNVLQQGNIMKNKV